MKKNRFIKLASGLFVLCLLTTCVVGATLAKYTTSGSGADTARVAKWGVTVSASGSLFGKQYANKDASVGSANEIYVSASDTASVSAAKNVVAPGTKNTTGLNFTVSGTPEVAYSLTIAEKTTATDIYLKAGTYGYMVAVTLNDGADLTGLYLESGGTYTKQTTGTYSSGTYYQLVEVATASADYYPISWSMGGSTYTSLSDSSNGLVKALKDLSKTVNAGVDAAINETITWAWDFDDNGSGTYDKLDTLLGDLMAGNVYTGAKALVVSTDNGANYKAAVVGTNYNLNVNLDIIITATQID